MSTGGDQLDSKSSFKQRTGTSKPVSLSDVGSAKFSPFNPNIWIQDVSQESIVFTLEGKSITVEKPPWGSDSSKDDSVALPSTVNERSVTYLASNGTDKFKACDRARLMTWGIIKMAHSSIVPQESLFKSSGAGEVFSLVPEPRSSIPLQWAHFGPGAIPNTLADRPCATMDVGELLAKLNGVLGTGHELDMLDLRRCLEHFLHTSRDFGHIYGILRGYWATDFAVLLSKFAHEQEHDQSMRRRVLYGGYITDSRMRPRRVWDLYSNRVLPFYALPGSLRRRMAPQLQYPPDPVWTVSHSWVDDSVRTNVWTAINGQEWPIPIPNDTTLDHVRVELLNLGAEYVWLDVLCLRQKGRPEDEAQRMEEWKLDVPTIGYIYSTNYSIPTVPCVTYFNGLGLPFDPSPEALKSDRHWLNRVWTLQEGTYDWLPGGATDTLSADAHVFFREHYSRAIPKSHHSLQQRCAMAIKAMQGRHCTTELDRTHGFAYILRCRSLPIYDEDMSPEGAWAALLKHLWPDARCQIALQYMRQRPGDSSLFPSWEDFMRFKSEDARSLPRPPGVYAGPRLVDKAHRGVPGPGTYFQRVTSSDPICIVREGKSSKSGYELLGLQAGASDSFSRHMITCRVGGMLSQGTIYRILQPVKPEDRILVVAEVVGERQIEEERTLENVPAGRQIGAETALEVVKRGCLFLPKNYPQELPCFDPMTVVYLSEERAQAV